MERKCLVLLCTYNGEKYIKQQIESIFNQSECSPAIVVHDDRSTDNTIGILKELQEVYGEKLTVVENEKNKGFSKNFIDIIYDNKDKDYDFFALADQDDYWKPEKLCSAMKLLEEKRASLYSSVMLLADQDLRPIGKFEHGYHRLNHDNASVQNVCTGCTVVFTKEFAKLLKQPRPTVYLHDYWLFLIAYYTGGYVYDTNGYILYRQHENNQIGQKKEKKQLKDKLKGAYTEVFKRNINKHTDMLRQFAESYGSEISAEDLATLKLVSSRKFADRLKVFFSGKYAKFGKKENLYFKIRTLFNLN